MIKLLTYGMSAMLALTWIACSGSGSLSDKSPTPGPTPTPRLVHFDVLLPDGVTAIEGIDSNRRFVHSDGILQADVIFVPLEDGDRCGALRRLGRDVLTVDLNPLSRTARTATVTIVDNVVRALPALLDQVERLRDQGEAALDGIIRDFDNTSVLAQAEQRIRTGGR